MLIVQKYGGSSVGTPEKIKAVANRIARTKQEGHSLVIVVSAMGDTTDDLLKLAQLVSTHPHKRELDVLLSAGERISMALLSMALRDLNVEAISFTGSQSGIITDESHTCASIVEIRPVRVQQELATGKVVIVAGFQGVSRTKEITTLGRGGSDTTAVALAIALKADRCEIWTDVPGIFSADPRQVPTARPYAEIPLDLVLEMAESGAQVMHARSIELACQAGISLFVGDTTTGEGTWIRPTCKDTPKVVAIVANNELPNAIVTVVGQQLESDSTILQSITSALQSRNISVVSLTYNSQSIKVTVSAQDSRAAVQILHEELSLSSSASCAALCFM